MGNNNRSGSFPNRPGEGQWGTGMGQGGIFAIPPPPPGHHRPPPVILTTGGRAKLNKAKNPWKPGRNLDDTKDEEQILIDVWKFIITINDRISYYYRFKSFIF